MTDASDREHAHDDTDTPLFDHARFAHGTPRALIERLRRERPLFRETDASGRSYWVVLLQEDIDTVLRNPALFSSREGPLIDDFPAEILAGVRVGDGEVIDRRGPRRGETEHVHRTAGSRA